MALNHHDNGQGAHRIQEDDSLFAFHWRKIAGCQTKMGLTYVSSKVKEPVKPKFLFRGLWNFPAIFGGLNKQPAKMAGYQYFKHYFFTIKF